MWQQKTTKEHFFFFESGRVFHGFSPYLKLSFEAVVLKGHLPLRSFSGAGTIVRFHDLVAFLPSSRPSRARAWSEVKEATAAMSWGVMNHMPVVFPNRTYQNFQPCLTKAAKSDDFKKSAKKETTVVQKSSEKKICLFLPCSFQSGGTWAVHLHLQSSL